MKRNSILKFHLLATLIAIITISTFFISSLIAEIRGDVEFIKTVKTTIFYCLPIQLIVMPTLGITGKKLAGNSKSKVIIQKLKRSKQVMLNGILLLLLATFLFYWSNYQKVDSLFLVIQLIEFFLGLFNLTLIILNVKAGMKLSGK